MKKLLLTLLILCGFIAQGQNITMPTLGNQTFTRASGAFSDSGGLVNAYSTNEDGTVTICPTTAGTKVKLVFDYIDIQPGIDANTCTDYIQFFSGTGTAAANNMGLMCGPYEDFSVQSFSADGCITIKFVSDGTTQGRGWNATISNITAICSPPVPVFTNSTAVICNQTATNPGNRTVTFNAAGSTTPTGTTISQYKWSWGDGQSTVVTTNTATHTYTNPGIYNVSLTLVNSSGCASVSPMVRKIIMTAAPLQVTNPSTNTINCGDSFNLTSTATSQTIMSSPPTVVAGTVALPDLSGAIYESPLDFSQMFEPGSLVTASCLPIVNFNLEHSHSGDLRIELVAPDGTAVVMFEKHGGGNKFGNCVNGLDNLMPGCPASYTVANSGGWIWTTAPMIVAPGTCAAYTGVCESGSYYPTGTYNSTNPFTAFVGKVISGVWKIRITDTLSADDGFLSGWSLSFPMNCYAGVEQETVRINSLQWTASAGAPTLGSQTVNNATINNPGPGCPADLVCQGNRLTNNITVGPFTTPGTYTYTTTAVDAYGCSFQKTVTVDVVAPTVNISYPVASVCVLSTTPINVVNSLGAAAAGGVYSALPTGLSMNATTGQISPSASTPGTYTVTYTLLQSGGCPSLTATATITITPDKVPVFTQVATQCYNAVIAALPTTSTNGVTGTWAPAINNTATTTYTFTPTAGLCSSPVTMTIVINPQIVFTNTGATAVCSGNSTAIGLNSTQALSYTWIASPTNVSGASNGTGSTINQVLTATTTNPGTVTYTVTPYYAGCAGTPRVIVVTVNPLPGLSVTRPVSVCSGTAPTLVFTKTNATDVLQWTVTQTNVTGATAGTGDVINQTLTNTGNTIGTVTYVVTPTSAAGCVGVSLVFSIQVNPIPVATATAVTNVLCSGSTTAINLTSEVTGTTFAWTAVFDGVTGTAAGTGNEIAQTLTSNRPTPGTVTYTITPMANGCTGTPITQVINVNPIPVVVPDPATTVLCSGSTTSIALISTTPGTTFAWTAVYDGAEGMTAGTGNFIGEAVTSTRATTGSVVFTITPTANGCVGIPVEVNITVHPNPVVEAALVADVLCSGSNVDMALTSTTPGTTFAWTATFDGVIGIAAGTGNTITGVLTSNRPTTGTVTYTITPSANGCTGTPITQVITVNPLPIAVATAAETTFCSGGTTNVSLTSTTPGTTFAWTAVFDGVDGNATGTGNIIAQTLTSNRPTPGTVTYTIIPTANNCSGSPITQVINVNPIPVAVATPTASTLCSDAAVNIDLTSTTPGTTFAWTATFDGVTGIAAGTGNTITGVLTSNRPTTGTVTYTITPSANGCTGTPITQIITVNPNPEVVATAAETTLCSGSVTSVVLTSTTPDTNFAWTAVFDGVTGTAAGTGNEIAQTLTSNRPTPGTVTYTITPMANGCTGTPMTQIINVNPIPVVVPDPATTVLCSGSTTSIALNSTTPGTTFAWTAVYDGVAGMTAGTGNFIGETVTSTRATTGSVVFTITPTANGCVGIPVEVNITVHPNPVVEAALVADVLCSGSNVDMALTSTTPGTTFAWTAVFSGTSGAVTGVGNQILEPVLATTDLPGSVTYTITPTANGCVGAPITKTITINPIPVAISTPAAIELCSGTSTAVVLSSATPGTTFTWSAVFDGVTGNAAGTGSEIIEVLQSDRPTSGTATYTIIPSANGCTGMPIVQVITVHANPLVVATPQETTLCSGSATDIALTSTTPGTTFSWTAVFDGVAGNITGTGATIAEVLTAVNPTPGTVTYTITPTANGCVGQQISQIINVNPIPEVTLAADATTLCSGEAVSITPSSLTPGTTFTWTAAFDGVTGTASGTGALTSQVLTSNRPTPGTVTYTFTPTASGCVGIPVSQVVVVNPLPNMVATTAQNILCSGSTATVDLSSSTPGTIFTWTATFDGVTGNANGTGNINEVLTSNRPTPGYVEYQISSSANGCAGATETVRITVNPIPEVQANPQTLALCSGSTTYIPLRSTTPGTTFSWTAVLTNVTGNTAGTGNDISELVATTTALPGSVEYTIVPTANGCVGEPIVITLIVNPIPDVVSTPNTTEICSGDSVDIALSSTTPGTVFTWSAVYTGASGASGGGGDVINTRAYATGATDGTVVYTITPTANGCVGSPITQVIVVHPNPVAVATATAQSICSGSTTNIQFTSETPGTRYVWTAVFNGTTGVSSGTGNQIQDLVITTGDDDGTVVYTVTPMVNDCVGTPFTYELDVKAWIEPTFTPIAAICKGEITNPLQTTSLEGIVGTWSPAFDNTQTTTYIFTPQATTDSRCIDQTQMTVVVKPIPDVQASIASTNVCSGTEVTINLNSTVAGTTYNWNVVSSDVSGAVGGSGTQIQAILTADTQLPGNVTYAITPINNGCEGTPITVEIQVNPIPDVQVAVQETEICSAATTLISLSGTVPGTTFTWTAIPTDVNGALAGTGALIEQQLTTNNPAGGQVLYIITPSVHGCEGTPVEVTVFVKPIPEVFGPSSLTICSGTNALIEVSASNPATTFEVTVQQNGVVGAFAMTGNSIDQLLETIADTNGTAIYTITPWLNGCEGKPITVPVYVKALPVVVLTDGYICLDSATDEVTSTYVIDTKINPTDRTFVWYLDGVILPFSTPSIVADTPGVYTVEVTDINTLCTSVATDVVVSASYSAVSVRAFITNHFDNPSINVEVEGTGNYQYQLDNNPFQDSPVFAHVLPGNHMITVIDKEGCTYREIFVNVLSFPNFFTPNQDGINDTWNIWSLSDQEKAVIYIYDRYGKLLKQIKPSGSGWDGTYNNAPVPSTDYWFVVEYLDGKDQLPISFRSHFSLKR